MKKQILVAFSCMAVSIFLLSMNVVPSTFDGDAKAGKIIFVGSGNCFVCHGATGKPIIPGVPNFSKGERLEKDNATLKNSIKNGVAKPKSPGAPPMPAYGGGAKLTDSQLDDLIAFIRSLNSKAKK